MNIKDIREIMGLTQVQVADELGVPRQEVIDCEENGETYLLLQYISAFPINPLVLKDPDADPFLPSFDQTTPGHRLACWREENGVGAAEFAYAVGITEDELRRFEAGEENQLTRRRGEEIEKKTGINRKWLMYGDGRNKGTPRIQVRRERPPKEEAPARAVRSPAPNREAGRRIRQAREAAKMTRETLAELLDLSVSRVTQMEAGYVKDQKAEYVISRIRTVNTAEGKEDPKSAGLRLRNARKDIGLSVKDAAALMGLKHTTLAHLESGYVSGKHADELIAMLHGTHRPGSETRFDARKTGARIREERIRAGLTQKELGTIMRMPTSRINLIELGNVTEKEARNILLRIQGKPTREVRTLRVRPADQVLLGSNIRDARAEAGLSQKKLGDLLELPQTRISMIERGRVEEAEGRRILQMLNEIIEKKGNGKTAPEKKAAAVPRAPAQPVFRPELGAEIREARLRAGLSQKQVAGLMGISQGRISYMEQGKTDEENARRVIRLIRDAAGKHRRAKTTEPKKREDNPK